MESGKAVSSAEVCTWGLERWKGVWRCMEPAEWVRRQKVQSLLENDWWVVEVQKVEVGMQRWSQKQKQKWK